MGLLLLIFLGFVKLISSKAPSVTITSPAVYHINQHSSIHKADTTVPYQINTPPQIGSLVQAIFEGDSGCKVVDTSAVLQRGNYIEIPIDKQEIAGSSWMTEIMSFTFNQKTQILYLLLDNGTLIQSEKFSLTFSENNKIQTKKYDRNNLGSTDTWFVSHYDIISLEDQLFCLGNQELSQIRLHQERYWRIDERPLIKNVVSLKIYENTMYAVTNTELITYSDQKQQSLRKGGRFQDILLLDNVLYLLDKDAGLIQIYKDQAQVEQKATWQVEKLENAVRLAGAGNTLMIIYQMEHKSYIGEYFVDSSYKLYRNRYYHNYNRIKDLHLFDNYAIVDAYNQFFIMHHSVNRQAFSKLTPLQFLYSSNATKISGIILGLTPFSFLIGSKNTIQHVKLSSNDYSLSSQAVECSKQQNGRLVVNITFKGPCALTYSPQKFICAIKVPLILNFQYNHQKRQSENNDKRLIIRLIWLILVIFSSIFCFVKRRRLKMLHRKLKEQAQLLREKRQQHSINMEQTFIPG